MTDIPRDLERAKCLEQAELYDDMKDAMKKVVISGHDLKTEDRNLLSVAYKNVVGKQRSVYRIISAKIAKLSDSTTNSSELEKTEAEEILKKTVGNLKTICEEVVVGKYMYDHLVSYIIYLLSLLGVYNDWTVFLLECRICSFDHSFHTQQ